MRAAHRLIVAVIATAIVLTLTLTPTHRASGTTRATITSTTDPLTRQGAVGAPREFQAQSGAPTTTVEATTTTSSTTLAPVTTTSPPTTARPAPRPVAAGVPPNLTTVAACIIRRENGGSYGRSTNPTHFGRYQFSAGSWAAYGGNPATWGTASPAEQDAVFARAMATPGGYLNWTKYDGC